MLIVIAFMTLATLCCAIAALHGGRDGRWAAGMTMTALVIDRTVGSVELQLAVAPSFRMFLDGALLVGYFAVMARSRRYWPIWIVGLQANGVLAHLTTWLVPHYTATTYRGIESVWGVPIVIIMAWGAALDRMHQQAAPQTGSDQPS